jgi:hypothetical protein
MPFVVLMLIKSLKIEKLETYYGDYISAHEGARIDLRTRAEPDLTTRFVARYGVRPSLHSDTEGAQLT